ncbi:MAG: hypothetical protein ACYDBB_10660 [Armatimonadota bacterium]
MAHAILLMISFCLTFLLPGMAIAQGRLALPPAQWRGETSTIEGVPGNHKMTLGYPEKQRSQLTWLHDGLPVGVYQLRLQVRASHVADEVSWNSGMKVLLNNTEVGDLPSIFFARANQPEWKTLQVVIPAGPLRLSLAAYADSDAFTHQLLEMQASQHTEPDDDPAGGMGEIALGLSPRMHQYFTLEQAELTPLTRSGYVAAVMTDKIRYLPGETLHGSATVRDVGGKGGKGTLTLYLEHDLNCREKVKELPVTLTREPQTLNFQLTLPQRELGYALVAVFTSADGKDSSEVAEYFTIVSNFYRTAIFGSGLRAGNTLRTLGGQRKLFVDMKANYQNCNEMFAWAEDDMVEMSPDTDWWFSGQTCYHLKKAGLKSLIAEAHRQGISCVTYGKFIMSGYLGWKTAYDYPLDHREQYRYPVGMWESVNVKSLDRFKNKEFLTESFVTGVSGGVFDKPLGWNNFLPINPDATPWMTRIAAEEMVRSIDMFGWDGVRWDGHPRGGGQFGGVREYDYLAARRTQALVRYFKDIVNAKYPTFRHGYNYLHVQRPPDPRWAIEDFELDELCRGGGLLMNESIRNSAGKPFREIAHNIQVEGDLCRERGGLLLGISCDGSSTRDAFVEAILYFAGGMRPVGLAATNKLINRYGTRYAKYVFDENLRRLATPEEILKPLAETTVWWQPFVYETPREGGTEQLVVNLLNIPQQATPKKEQDKHPKWDMNPGTEPFTLRLTLPAGYTVTGASFIDPLTLAVTPADIKEDLVTVPAVGKWLVLVVDLAVTEETPTLAAQFGPPRTFGVQRDNLDIARIEVPPLDITKDAAALKRTMAQLTPKTETQELPESELNALDWDARNAMLLAQADARKPMELLNGWWKGGSLPQDLKLKDTPPVFPDLTPRRDGRLDIHYGRGALDYRLQMWEAFAGLPCAQVHDAPLRGMVRRRSAMWLHGGKGWQNFPAFDLLIYTGIPHAAIGAENSYALVKYVKAGGGVLFTGGEYAFGKGGYDFTVLERELLPVRITETMDVHYAEETPFVLEPGKDFAELGIQANFAAKPAFCCYNRVALKPDPKIKVFLQCGNRPILVGWQLGKGRVACLLLDHRGMSGDGVNMYFDWQDWPALLRAVMQWAAPDAMKVDLKPAQPNLPALLQTLAADTATDVSIRKLHSDDPENGLDLGLDSVGMILDEKSLAKRISLLQQLLQGEGTEVGLVLADQAVKVGNLPDHLREELLDFVRCYRPENGLTAIAVPAVTSTNPAARYVGLQILGLAGGPAFLKVVQAPPDAEMTNPFARDRALACGIALCPTPDLLAWGKAQMAAINQEETDRKREYTGFTGGTDFSLAATEQPCINSETYYLRVGWLAYLARLEPAVYGVQFTREWLMIGEYADYVDLTLEKITRDRIMTVPQKHAKTQELHAFLRDLTWLDRVTTPALEHLLKMHPEAVARGFVQAHFNAEADRAMNFLLRYPIADTKPVLSALGKAQHEKLAAFGKARMHQP